MTKQAVAARATLTCLVLLSVLGGGLIVWWAVAFHRDNGQLWMVPIGLVLLGTPLVAWVSVFASDSCRRSQLLLTAGNGGPNLGPLDPETGPAGAGGDHR